MKRSGLLVGMVLFLVSSGFSVPLTVSWTEGSVMVRSGNAWKTLDVGSSLDSASVIRLLSDSFVEFAYSGGTLVLSSEGMYTLDKLLAYSSNQREERSSILAKVGKMITNQAPLSTTVAGVRGSEQDSSSNVDWILEDESGASVSDPAGKAYTMLRKGAYQEAAKAFSDLIPTASFDVKPEYQYAQAWCLASANDLVGSIKLLRSMPSSGPFAVQRALLLSRLNLDTGAFKDAVQILESVRLFPELRSDDRLLVQRMLQEATTLQSQ